MFSWVPAFSSSDLSPPTRREPALAIPSKLQVNFTMNIAVRRILFEFVLRETVGAIRGVFEAKEILWATISFNGHRHLAYKALNLRWGVI